MNPEEPSYHTGDRTNTWALRVLVVEDCPETAATLTECLQRHGYVVSVASDGPTALAAARTLQPDAILLDIGLPGMDGWEVVEQLRKQVVTKRPLLIAITGLQGESHALRSEQVGIDLHLTKPIDFDQLNRLLVRFSAILAP
jgi:CheY-like chemotaxis protein